MELDAGTARTLTVQTISHTCTTPSPRTDLSTLASAHPLILSVCHRSVPFCDSIGSSGLLCRVTLNIVIQVAFETVWDTSKFNSLWPSGTPNPYVWSFEGTAAGTHADYMFGWKGDSLQRAMDKSECFYDGCGSITKQQMSVANQCTIKETVQEQTDGCKY